MKLYLKKNFFFLNAIDVSKLSEDQINLCEEDSTKKIYTSLYKTCKMMTKQRNFRKPFGMN